MMTHRQKWLLATALLCLSAVGAQRLRAQEAEPIGPSRLPAPATQAIPLPEPDRQSFDRLMHEAELAYRSQQSVRALSAFTRLVELDRLSVRAWLRLGNLHQQAGRTDEAVIAYRNAALGVPLGRIDEEARDKALGNLALLGIEQARKAIDALKDSGSGRVRAARAQAVDQLRSERRRYERVAPEGRSAGRTRGGGSGEGASGGTRSRHGGAQSPDSATGGGDGGSAPVVTPVSVPAVRVSSAPEAVPAAGTTAAAGTVPAAGTEPAAGPVPMAGTVPAAPPPSPNEDPEAARPFEPYTVDRWIATPRRPTRTSGRSAVSEPLVEDPLPPLPGVEHHQALPAGGRRGER